ncbi:hypothetical protein FHX82_005795 [Amycolatopsis bartoniae]|uniref:Uncharacterized protein n=1 Tax=Amycolatopsis bartoniae TaxID=941986 RepID=A0A8H9M836_9PSEU|nr:hypothetical protein [Amycolatopsis bartoniae]MBB2938717.1 hypothetical protein [Amycolatopsis bartoniae]TVT11498.1 hypothetical protein FNH07_01360 [Amycolatopsis bartoniae]GHF79653.1 hypothetical protein GCM10017566_62300 [Amycolatopsis bartoniae]
MTQVPEWWPRVVAAGERLAAVDTVSELGEFRFVDKAQVYLRIGEAGREFASAAEIGTAERVRVLAVLEDVLEDPAHRPAALTFLTPLAERTRLAELQRLWSSLGPRVRQELALLAAVVPDWMEPAVPAPAKPVVRLADPVTLARQFAESGFVPAAEVVASWQELAELARDELERCGVPASVTASGADAVPTGVCLSVSLEEPYGVFLEWNPLDSGSRRYRALTESRSGTAYLADYIGDVRGLLARAALEVLAAAGFRTLLEYDFLFGGRRAYRVLAPPQRPFA